MTPPAIHKAEKVTGHTLVFRDASVADAEFILSLRTDPEKNRYLSTTSSDIEPQRGWLKEYANRRDSAYFIITYQGEDIGTVRLYDARKDSFCWGSWILKDSRPSHAALESMLMVYAYAVDHLGFRASHFDVRKENVKVWRFHERLGAERVGETDIDYFFSMNFAAISATRERFRDLLPRGVNLSKDM